MAFIACCGISTFMTSVALLNNDLRAKIQDIFREVFDDDRLQLRDDTSPENLAAWDSLGHIRLISALEDDLHLSFTLEEIEVMNSVKRILTLMADKAA